MNKSVFDLLFDEKKSEKKLEEKFNVVIKVFETVYKAKESIIFEEGEIKCDGAKVANAPVCPTPIEIIKGKYKNGNFFK